MRKTPDAVCRQIKEDMRYFRYLDKEAIEILKPRLTCLQISAGEILWTEGDPGDTTVFVASGHIEEKKNTQFEGKQVVVGVYGPGTVLGEFGLLENHPRAFTVLALEDTDLLVLGREDFDRLLEEHPTVGIGLLKGILLATAIRLEKSYDRLASIF
ncbi:MAG: cyclic nucleotide-binding domain-containing protein [Geoalkalibacter sp.]|uniref:cyclic nucleotide-binding domain-containing protein n=1 Tax=Geoalkalibacter sp. TaxID=3041440 RepID=UPI002A97B830|nr:cyclic nucleotide-binding domain-containing protein [Thermodesulfobacteriota bacterium]